MCVPVSESRLQGRAVGLQSAHSDTHLLRLCLLSLQSCSQLLILGPQPLDASEVMKASKTMTSKKVRGLRPTSYCQWSTIFSGNRNNQMQYHTRRPPAQPLRLRVQADGAGSGTEGGKRAQRSAVPAHTQGCYSPGSSPVEERRTREGRRGPVWAEGSGCGPVGRRATA